MKAFKIAALAVLGLLVLMAIAVAVVAWRFDPAWAKQKLIQTVQEQKQRTLKLDGDLALTFYPSLGVKLGKASLSERNSTQEFASVENARISVRLLPLLARQAVVDRVELAGLRAQVVRDKEGKFNFDDLLAKSEASGPAETSESAGTPVKFDIAGVSLSNSAISFRDDKTGQAIQLNDVALKTGNLSDSASGPLELAFKASAAKPKLGASISFAARYRYDLARKQFALEKPDLKVKGEVLDFKELDAALSAKEAGVGGGQGGIQVEALALTAKGRLGEDALDAKVDVPHLALLAERASGQKASAHLQLAGKQRQLDAKLDLAAVEGSATQWKIGKVAGQWSLKQDKIAATGQVTGAMEAGDAGIRIDGLALTAQGKLDADSFDAKFDVPRLAWAGERASGEAASGTLRMAGPQKQLDAKLDLSGFEGSAALLKIGNLAAQWSLKQGPLDAQGKTAGAVQANLKGQVVDLPKLIGELQIAHPQLPMKQLKMPLDASVHADWGKSQASGTLSTRFDESAVQGKFQVAKFSPLAAGFDLGIDRLNIDKYFPETPGGKPTAAPAPAPSPASTAGKAAPIDFSFLRGLDLKGAVRIGFLQARNLKFNNVSTNLVAQNGRLDLSPLSASLYGGSLAGSLSAQAEGNRLVIKQTLDNVAIGPLIKDYSQKDVLEGRGRIALDVSSAGNSVIAVRQSLNGTASMSLRDGAVKGINLAKSLRQAKAIIPGGKQDATVAADKTEKTDFSEMTASFKIANGVARNDDLSAKSPFLRAGGAGNIDLAREQLDYLAKVTVVGSSKGQEGKDLADLNGLTIPVRLTGSFDNPSWHLEFGAMATELAKQQAQKQVQKQLEKQLDKKGLGEALKGLIK